jgi:hypothetical protein
MKKGREMGNKVLLGFVFICAAACDKAQPVYRPDGVSPQEEVKAPF